MALLIALIFSLLRPQEAPLANNVPARNSSLA